MAKRKKAASKKPAAKKAPKPKKSGKRQAKAETKKGFKPAPAVQTMPTKASAPRKLDRTGVDRRKLRKH